MNAQKGIRFITLLFL